MAPGGSRPTAHEARAHAGAGVGGERQAEPAGQAAELKDAGARAQLGEGREPAAVRAEAAAVGERAESEGACGSGNGADTARRCAVATCARTFAPLKARKFRLPFKRNSLEVCKGCSEYFCKDHLFFLDHGCANNLSKAKKPSSTKPKKPKAM